MHGASLTRTVARVPGSAWRPGTRAKRGWRVLFLDALPEFARTVPGALRAVLRQPPGTLRVEGHVTIARAAAALTYPARCIVVGAMNPCPCGCRGDSVRPCACSEHQVHRYLSRISGPLLDRIDIQRPKGTRSRG